MDIANCYHIKNVYNIDVFEGNSADDIIVKDLDFDLFDDYRNDHVSNEENKTQYIIN